MSNEEKNETFFIKTLIIRLHRSNMIIYISLSSFIVVYARQRKIEANKANKKEIQYRWTILHCNGTRKPHTNTKPNQAAGFNKHK